MAKIISKSYLKKRVAERYSIDLGEIRDIKIVKKGESGRIHTIEITGTQKSVRIGKELSIRRLLADDCLYSSWFTIHETGDSYILHGKGWGHGVGLCQIGAARMALSGKNYKEILEFYYPGTDIKKAYD